MKKIAILLLFLAVFFCFAKEVFAVNINLNLPNPYSFMNDYANVMSAEARVSLEQRLTSFSQEKGKDVYVVIVGGLQGATAKDYITQLFERWRVDKKGLDGGALILIAPSEGKVIIESGYLLQNVIPRETIQGIIDEKILPQFQKGDYDEGISSGVGSILDVVSGKKIYLKSSIFNLNVGIMIVIFLATLYIMYNIVAFFRKKKIIKI